MPKGVYVRTEEHRRINSRAKRGVKFSEEACRHISESHRGKYKGDNARGYWISQCGGYKVLTGQQGHPLATKTGSLYEHRKVLYEEIGPGPHECHWNAVSGCGKTDLVWGGHSLHPDHLDGDTSNNDLENLVPSCAGCNVRRARVGNPVDWDGTVVTVSTPNGKIFTMQSKIEEWRL